MTSALRVLERISAASRVIIQLCLRAECVDIRACSTSDYPKMHVQAWRQPIAEYREATLGALASR
jgi:hypothetical protein